MGTLRRAGSGGVWGQHPCVFYISVQGDFQQPLPGSEPMVLGADGWGLQSKGHGATD